jgi:hypothetical protein
MSRLTWLSETRFCGPGAQSVFHALDAACCGQSLLNETDLVGPRDFRWNNSQYECRFLHFGHHPAFQAGGDVAAKFTCNGANVNPELKINGIPNEAKSLS